MKRRDAVQALLTPAEPSPAEDAPVRVASGAVRAMGLEIDRLADGARDAAALRSQIESGTAVLDLPPDLVDPSFVSDRLARTEDAEFRRLVESVRETGQQVPILVRPHPDSPGRYQVAYGHRRRDAAAELGLPVRAIVRALTDAELVVAQGKENGERRNLSFIERALFAADLQRRGFDRATLHGALGVQSAEMTRLLTVAAAVPSDLVRQIGPAPKAGRNRWMALARELQQPGTAEMVGELLDRPETRKLPSDRRFSGVMTALRSGIPATPGNVQVLTDMKGTPLLRIERGTDVVRVTLYERAAPGIANLLLRDAAALVGRYLAGHR
jgi:ParB family transcriptional regulator, chromosome partitioning protein